MAEHGTLSPDCVYAIARKAVKGEDRHLVVTGPQQSGLPRGEYSVVAVFDGHGGRHAAETCTREFRGALSAALRGCVEGHVAPAGDEATPNLAASLPCALVAAFAEVDARVRATCASSGCTATVVVCGPGRLVTVAACGDSLAVLDTLTTVQKLSPEHRAQTHAGERARVIAAGAHVGSATDEGTLRVWPGGLAVTRAIGDAAAKPAVCAHPEVSQCYVPLGTGARLVVASDGLWDVVPSAKAACSAVRKLGATAAANALVRQAGSVPKGEQDDVTVCVIDFLAHPGDKGPFQSLGAGHGATAAKVALKWPIAGMSDRPHAGYAPPTEDEPAPWVGAEPTPVPSTGPFPVGLTAGDFVGDWMAPAGQDGAEEMDWVPVQTHKRRAHQHTHSADGSVEQHTEHGAAAAPVPMAVDNPQVVAPAPLAEPTTVAAGAPPQRPARKALPKPKPRHQQVATPTPEAPAVATAPAPLPAQLARRKQADSQRKSARGTRPLKGAPAPAPAAMATETAAVHSRPQGEQPQQPQQPLPQQQQQRMTIPKPRPHIVSGTNSVLVPPTPAQAAPPPLVLPTSWQPPQPVVPLVVPAGGLYGAGMPAFRFGSFGAPPRVYQLEEVERELTAHSTRQ
jgi:serine/threonine protein phosphatase PrpC